MNLRSLATPSMAASAFTPTATDYSRWFKNMGIDVNVIRAGAMKGAGTPGTPVTDAQCAEKQRMVDAYYGQFVDAVSMGRKMPREKALALADGRVYVGAETLAAGLADSVDTFDSMSSRIVARAKGQDAGAWPARIQKELGP